ncbi:MAG: two pore domain potassium channel family protein [Sphingomonas sp.]|nr:two pore domain potassium channel family protein [Sphingomonas sp.]
MVLLTVTIHGAGLMALSRVMRLEATDERRAAHGRPGLRLATRAFAATMAIVLALFTLHGIEIWLYALVYLMTGAMAGLEHAVYFSTITYATIGYDDQGLGEAWKLVAAIEGVNGVILLGWSTAFFVTMVGRLRPA